MIDFVTSLMAGEADAGAFLAAGLIAFTVIYFAYRVLLIRVMQPVRLEFADEGLKLLSNDNLSEQEKRFVRFYLDDAFEWRLAPVGFFLFVPMLAMKKLRIWLGRDAGTPKQLREFLEREEVSRFSELHLYCIAGSNPFWALLFMIQVLFVGLIWFTCAQILQMTSDAEDQIKSGVRDAQDRFKSRIVAPLAVRVHGQSPFPDGGGQKRRAA